MNRKRRIEYIQNISIITVTVIIMGIVLSQDVGQNYISALYIVLPTLFILSESIGNIVAKRSE